MLNSLDEAHLHSIQQMISSQHQRSSAAALQVPSSEAERQNAMAMELLNQQVQHSLFNLQQANQVVLIIRDQGRSAPAGAKDSSLEYYLTFSDVRALLDVQLKYRKKVNQHMTLKQTHRQEAALVDRRYDENLLFQTNTRPATGGYMQKNSSVIHAGTVGRLVSNMAALDEYQARQLDGLLRDLNLRGQAHCASTHNHSSSAQQFNPFSLDLSKPNSDLLPEEPVAKPR